MSGFVKGDAQKTLDFFLGYDELEYALGVFIVLFTGNPGETGSTLQEVKASEYARQPVQLSPAVNGASSNIDDIAFPVASSDWGVITHVGIAGAVVGTNVRAYDNLSVPRYIRSGDQLIFPEGQFQIKVG